MKKLCSRKSLFVAAFSLVSLALISFAVNAQSAARPANPGEPAAAVPPSPSAQAAPLPAAQAAPAGEAAPASEQAIRIPLIGETAPAFEADTTQGPINFPSDYRGKWIVFFSHPSDFTPVCTTEFVDFAAAQPEFEKLNAQLLGLSIDSRFSHIAWLRTISERVQYKGKSVQVNFPVVEDLKMNVSRKYGMLQPSASTTSAVRAVFIIDPQAKVRAVIYYPMTNGRNIQEIKRLLIALQTTDKFKVATPADWQPGDDVIVPAPGSMASAAERSNVAGKEGYRYVDWFLTFKPLPKEQLSYGGIAVDAAAPSTTQPAR